jgi:uncharacterized membrane protein
MLSLNFHPSLFTLRWCVFQTIFGFTLVGFSPGIVASFSIKFCHQDAAKIIMIATYSTVNIKNKGRNVLCGLNMYLYLWSVELYVLLYLTLYIMLFNGRQMLCSMSVRKCIRFCIPE